MDFPKVDLFLLLWQVFNYVVDVIRDCKEEAQIMSVYLCLPYVYIILPHERIFIGYAIDCYDVELPLYFLQIEKRVVNCVYLFNKHSARQRNLAPNDIKPTYRLDFIKAFNTPNQPRELKSSASRSLNRKVEEVSKEMFFKSVQA